MRIAWLSKYVPLDSQKAELDRLFGPHELVVDTRQFRNAGEIRWWIQQQCGINEVVIVAPLTLIKHLCEDGMRPLFAVMKSAEPGTPGAEIAGDRGNHFGFSHFERVVSVEMKTEPVIPAVRLEERDAMPIRGSAFRTGR